MRIEGYSLPARPISPMPRPASPAPVIADAAPQASAEPVDESAALSPQERLRRLLDERRAMNEAVFGVAADDTLGKHIDLRV